MSIKSVDIVTYGVDEISEIFKCGKNKAYAIMTVRGFPSIRIGNKIIVEKSALEAWMTANRGKEILI